MINILKYLFIPLLFFFGKEQQFNALTRCYDDTGAVGKTYYYDVTKTFYESGYTYQCDVPPSKNLTLYNKANRFTYTEQTYRDGSPISEETWRKMMDGELFLIEDDTWTKSKCNTIVNSAFSSEQREMLKNASMTVTMTIDPSTGKVIEVDFVLLATTAYAKIPVSVYRNIEVGLKNNIWFTLTPFGKQLNRVKRGWSFKTRTSRSSGEIGSGRE
jgi:hypothetical protein